MTAQPPTAGDVAAKALEPLDGERRDHVRCGIQAEGEFITVGITLAFLGAVQAAAIAALDHKDIPIFDLLAMAFHWVAGTLIYMLVTRPGPMVRGMVAHGVTSAVIIVGGAWSDRVAGRLKAGRTLRGGKDSV